MKKSILLFASLLLAMAACSDKEVPASEKSKEEESSPAGPPYYKIDIPHYVTGYIYPDSFKAKIQQDRLEINYDTGQDLYYVHYANEFPMPLAQYKVLCEKRGDMSYSRIREVLVGEPDPYVYLANDIVSIDVVAGEAWEEYPAGGSWANLCWIVSTTPREYIASGYTKRYDWSVVPNYFSEGRAKFYSEDLPGLTPVSKPLVDCTPEDLSLISFGSDLVFNIHFIDGPRDLQPYNLTVIITTADGKVWSVPVEY